jgi:Cu-Zn family superoxide dismutase
MNGAMLLTAAAVAVLLSGCESYQQMQGAPRANAQLEAVPGGRVWGAVTFIEAGGKVLVRADVRGLPQSGEFGFHVHEKGDCTAKDFTSAGGHFNPAGKPHSHFDKPERHAGDMPNLKSNGEGDAIYSFETSELTVRPGPNSVVGRAVVIHANPDDYKSQPAGNSGPRIACGLIRAS